jgi:NADH-quinone oxidoreductase subunit I
MNNKTAKKKTGLGYQIYLWFDYLYSTVVTLWGVLSHTFTKADTVEYPDEQPHLYPRFRGRIVLTKDPSGEERCVACNLCASACPTDCISLQKTEDESGRWYADYFRINFSRCVYCGLCEEACPTYAIQLTPDFEMAEYVRQNMVYEKEHLLINGPGKHPDYSFYAHSGKAVSGRQKGEGINEAEPVDVRSLLP